MATKAEPKQRYEYTFEHTEVFSERLDVRRGRDLKERAYSEDQARFLLKRRYPLVNGNNLRLVGVKSIAPRRPQPPEPTPTLF